MLFIGFSSENYCDSALLDGFQKCNMNLCSIIGRRCISLKSKKVIFYYGGEFIEIYCVIENTISFSDMLCFFKTRVQSCIALIMLYTNILTVLSFFLTSSLDCLWMGEFIFQTFICFMSTSTHCQNKKLCSFWKVFMNKIKNFNCILFDHFFSK